MQKIRKKYILILFALFPISIAEKQSTHKMIKDEKNHILFYYVRPENRREQAEKELQSKSKMIEKLVQKLKDYNQSRH